jgi:hypothetical protein
MPEPITAAAMKLLSGILPSAGMRVLGFGRHAHDRRRFARGELEADRGVAKAIELAGKRMSQLATELPGGREAEVKAFLESPEAAQLIRQLFVIQSGGGPLLPGEVKRQFTASLAAWLRVPPERLEPHGSAIFDQFAAATRRALDIARRHGDRSAETAHETLRDVHVREHLIGIERNLELLAGSRADRDEIADFEQRYRAHVLQTHTFLRPPSFEGSARHRLDQLYVAPRLRRVEGEDVWLSYREFGSEVWRAVILGDPGGGKSSLAAKLCSDAIQGRAPFGGSDFPRTPLLVPLRDYLNVKRAERLSLLRYIERRVAHLYQIETLPRGAMPYLLRNGRAFFVFDELDEVLKRVDRQEVVSDIENVVMEYLEAPAIVLSRRNGYIDAPLRDDWFDGYELGGFDDPEVADYADRWFALGGSADDPKRDIRRRDSFLEDTLSVPDLRRNPLMLGLLANMYKGKRSIPENRPQVLKKCATMLYDEWDRQREIFIELPLRPDRGPHREAPGISFELDLRRLLEFLANWIYNDSRLQDGVVHERLVDEAASYLARRSYEDEGEARIVADALMRFCRGRAWVFSSAGRSEWGETLYRFTHQTFLEYFAASHLVAVHATPTELFTALWPRIRDGEADELVHLAMHLQHERLDDAADRLIGSLLANAPVHEHASTAILALTASTLGFLVPTAECVRRLTERVVQRAGVLSSEGKRDAAERVLLSPLAAASPRVGRHVARQCETMLATETDPWRREAASRVRELQSAAD